MKKLFILIVTMLFLSGCYDYKEINNLAFVSAVGVDYVEDEYVISLEVLNDKVDKASMKINTYIETGRDKHLGKALEKATSKINNFANFTHTKLMVISKSIAEDKLNTIVDLFLRSTNFRENFYVVSALNDSPESILKTTNKENPIASSAIIEMLENNDYASNSAVLKTFDKIIEEILTFGIDTCFSNIAILNDNFIIDGMVIYSDYELASFLDNNDATMYNILKGNIFRPIYSKDYDGKSFAVAIATGKPEIALEKENLAIKGTITGKIMNNEPGFDIRNLKDLNKINNDFAKILSQKSQEFIKKLQDSHSDILGISKSYYQKTREKNNELWQVLPIKTDIKFNINKKGLIYEVPNEK